MISGSSSSTNNIVSLIPVPKRQTYVIDDADPFSEDRKFHDEDLAVLAVYEDGTTREIQRGTYTLYPPDIKEGYPFPRLEWQVIYVIYEKDNTIWTSYPVWVTDTSGAARPAPPPGIIVIDIPPWVY
jgi:hypothetical protein